MRIIGGVYKGIRIDPPGGLPARPTTDRAKEALMNILVSGLGIEGSDCLDLFSGTGNIAFELASRGARSVAAVDIHAGSLKFIQSMFQKLKYHAGQTRRANVTDFLVKPHDERYDLIFADPPYELHDLNRLPELVFKGGWLNPGGWLVIEHRNTLQFDHPALFDRRVYGQSCFSFFKQPE